MGEVFYINLTLSGAFTDAEVEQIKSATGASDAIRLPPTVRAACDRALLLGFKKSSAPETGRFLSALAAAVRYRGRVLEMGTGAGVGLAWILHGLDARTDVEVVSIEKDSELAAHVRAVTWPEWVHIVVGDAAEITLPNDSFDLVFADTPIVGGPSLHKIISIVRPGGALVFDDAGDDRPTSRARISSLRRGLFEDSRVVCAYLAFSTGIIFVTRKVL